MKVISLLKETRKMNKKSIFFLNNRIDSQIINKNFPLNIVRMEYFFQVFMGRITIDKTNFL